MSTDSTELTFVRCPACRSLVPAVSTRCRMCGATLDASAKVEQSEEAKKGTGRVRQRTMSQPQSELSDAAEQIRDDFTAPVETAPEADNDPFDFFDETEPEVEILSATEGLDSGDDPLGQYIEEVDDSSAEAGAADVSAAAEIAVPEKPVSQEIKAAPQPERREQEVQAKQEKEKAPADHGNRHNNRDQGRGREDNKPKVVVEQGSRHSGKPSNLSFGKGREEKQEDRKPQQQNNFEHKPKVEAKQNENVRPEKSNKQEQDLRNNKQEKSAMLNRADNSESRNEARLQSGKLFGWLVSYENPDGKAIELREGKFFITGSMLKESDLVIERKGLSTPHAMASLNSAQGFRLQDLMSEGGLFVKKKGKDSYQREETPVTLEHGDWVKLAEAEYLVALILNQK